MKRFMSRRWNTADAFISAGLEYACDLMCIKAEQTAYDSAKLLVQETDAWQENIKAAMERVGEDFKKKRVFPVGLRIRQWQR